MGKAVPRRVLQRCPDTHDNALVLVPLLLVLSPSGHGVASIPIRVLYSHAGPVGTAEDLSFQTTKSSDHVKDQVI